MSAVDGAAGVPFGGALGRGRGRGLGSGPSSADSADAARGRTRITSKAISRVATALAAEALGVSTRSVNVRLSDDNGMLAVTVSGPIRVPALNDLLGADGAWGGDAAGTLGVPGASGAASRPGTAGTTILERCEQAQQHIREVAATLTGASISRVTVHLTGIETTQKERVK